MPDIEPFKSPVDGSIVTGRAALREHNLRNNVTNTADYKNEWAEAAKKRENFRTGRAKDPERTRELIKAWEKHQTRRR
jgi:hypothetical protein